MATITTGRSVPSANRVTAPTSGVVRPSRQARSKDHTGAILLGGAAIFGGLGLYELLKGPSSASVAASTSPPPSSTSPHPSSSPPASSSGSSPGVSTSPSSAPPSSPPWTWGAWWSGASFSDRAAVACYWAVLNRPPQLPAPGISGPALGSAYGDPWAAWYNGNCGYIGNWLDNGASAQIACAAFRFLSDCGCEFVNTFAASPGTCEDSICFDTNPDCANFLSRAGSRLLGRSWAPDSQELAACSQPYGYASFGPQPLTGNLGAITEVACSTEFTDRINGLAGASTPPWGSGAYIAFPTGEATSIPAAEPWIVFPSGGEATIIPFSH